MSLERLGTYISVPFCKAKCSYCNFASGVFAASRMQAYVDRVCGEIAGARNSAETLGAMLPLSVDSVFFGGGTPSLLEPEQLRQVFAALRGEFEIVRGAEVTVECAPGQIPDKTLEMLLECGTNRISFGVQSFVDREAAAVGRLHTAEMALAEIERMRRAGIAEINVDLIAGLPHQDAASWEHSLQAAIESCVNHISVYMLEVDEDSRLGREVMAGGTKYHAHFIPDDEVTAELYLTACERLETAGVAQYEISNFARGGARGGHASRHNMKYWKREPYLGFGLDAHSMLRCEPEAVRFANTDDLDRYIDGAGPLAQVAEIRAPEFLTRETAAEERVFLGMRLNEGMALDGPAVDELLEARLLERSGEHVRLSARGRLISNDVFGRLLESVEV